MATGENRCKSKHYTPTEKSLFLQILNKYKNVIESKKSNNTTLRDKEYAWSEICEEFNNSSLITRERNVQQLKKLWTNMKQTQRDAITKERQNRFATGGGSEAPAVEIDPEIATIAPNLMVTAPTLFSSNMEDEEIAVQQQLVYVEEGIAELNVLSPEVNITAQPNKTGKKRKFSETEDEIRVRKIQNIIDQDRHLANVKLEHEERMARIKEDHLKEMNKIEIRTALAKAELAEILLKKEKDV